MSLTLSQARGLPAAILLNLYSQTTQTAGHANCSSSKQKGDIKKSTTFNKYLTIPEAAHYLGLSCARIYQLIQTGADPLRSGCPRQVVIRLADLGRWLDRPQKNRSGN
jgi:excisionase family DNA binding protein